MVSVNSPGFEIKALKLFNPKHPPAIISNYDPKDENKIFSIINNIKYGASLENQNADSFIGIKGIYYQITSTFGFFHKIFLFKLK